VVLPETGDWKLEVAEKGRLDRFVAAEVLHEPLAEGAVRVDVRAAGVNFRDVLNALGMVPIPWLGLEVAGVVTEVGLGVEHVSVGQRVLGMGQATFSSSTVADGRLLTPIPDGMSFEEAATIPLVFLTAWYALHDLAALKSGETILIHAAAGGVGMAAYQLATLHGATVYATASEPKWNKLREMGLEDGYIASSRDLAFGESFKGHTGGRGVDVVLNALAREFVDTSLSLLSEGGRFLEMGKTDIREDAWIEANHPGVRYCAFDLMEAGPDRIQAMLIQLMELFATGKISPLPLVSFPMTRIAHVFRFMAQAKHIGKLVLVPELEQSIVRPASTVLVTGGLGALGREVGRWLAAQAGVEHLVLTSRRGLASDGAQMFVTELEELGVAVTVAACDVSDAYALRGVLDAIPAERPLRGVIHTAGVLDDGILSALDQERMRRVMAPKVDGAWNLHEFTQHLQLDFFVLFSSAAGIMGAPGQGNYAAANSFMDALAEHRRSMGKVGVSIAWGPWAEGGMAAELDAGDQARMQRQGVGALDSGQGMALLERAILEDQALSVAVNLDVRRLGQIFERGGMGVPPLYRALVRSTAGGGSAPNALKKRLAALQEDDRAQALLEVIRAEVAQVLGLPSERDVDVDKPMQEMGTDSLMAVELYNRLSTLAGTKLPTTLVFDYPTVRAMSGFIMTQIELPEVVDDAERQLRQSLLAMLQTISMAELEERGILEQLRALAGASGAQEEGPVDEANDELRKLEDLADNASEDELLSMLAESLDELEGEI
ncbi:MAG: type I polyketide synthase, partial [Myxococcota bacterium]|nr:type I polyketide synthase [Myxococcota bacterium]